MPPDGSRCPDAVPSYPVGVAYVRTALVIAVVATGAALVGTSGQASAVASLNRCGSGALQVVIAGRHHCLQRGVTCRSRLNSAYHRYLFHCSGSYLVYWWTGLLRRPLHIPMLSAGSACPAADQNGTLGNHGNLDVPSAPAFGPGPAYPTLGSDGGRAVFRYGIGWTPYEGWEGSKLLWTVPGYNGPYVVRGQQLDGPNELEFDQGPNWTNKLHTELRLVGPYSRLNPAATYLRVPGCYAYQVDGRGFSYLIVFEAQIISPS
jgi:hypothetical protein